MPRLAAITYEGLPLASGGAHKLRTRGFVAAFNALQSFASAVSLDAIPKEVLVEVVTGDGVPKEFFDSLSPEFDANFMRRPSRAIGAYTGHQWEINAACIDRIVDQFEKLRPVPQAGFAGGAAVVHVTWNLVLADKERKPLPHQDKDDYLGYEVGCKVYLGESLVYARISETTTAHLFLSLPFENVTDDARRLAAEIESRFPCRLSSKHWKMWRLTKNGRSYVGRKIPGLTRRERD